MTLDSAAPSPLPATVTEAVDLLSVATQSNNSVDEVWLLRFQQWLFDIQGQTGVVQRLRHALAFFAVDQPNEPSCLNHATYGCLAMYLDSLRNVTTEELQTPMWQQDDQLDAAYGLLGEEAISRDAPGVPVYLVFDVIIGIVKNINLNIVRGTPYMHCAPLTMGLLNHRGWNPCQIISHFHNMRQCQFELLNDKEDDLPGEVQTIHGILAMNVLSYMHSTAWTPVADEYTPILDSLVWDVLCLNGLGDQAAQWLDTTKNRLPNAGLDTLCDLSVSNHLRAPFGTPMHVYTPAFSSLRNYAHAAWQDYRSGNNRALWFERRHPRLAGATAMLLQMLPAGPRDPSDWDALRQWWCMDVQGLPTAPIVPPQDLPSDFE